MPPSVEGPKLRQSQMHLPSVSLIAQPNAPLSASTLG